MMNFILFILLVLPFASNASFIFGNLFSSRPSKDQCPIQLYNSRDASFTGVKLYANAETFHPLLIILSDYAKRCQVKINVKRAYSPVKKIMTDDHRPSALELGEAIEFDLVDKNDRIVCDRLCMEKSFSQLKRFPNAKCFLRKISRNPDLQRDSSKPTIVMKRRKSNESFVSSDNQLKSLQNNCKNLPLYQ